MWTTKFYWSFFKNILLYIVRLSKIRFVIPCLNFSTTAQWSEGVTKPPWSFEQIEVNLSILEAFGYILSRKLFSYIFKA